MLTSIVISAVVAAASAACPADYSDRILRCLEPLASIKIQNSHGRPTKLCQTMTDSAYCMDQIATECWNSDFVQATVHGFHVTSDDVKAMCNGRKRSAKLEVPVTGKRSRFGCPADVDNQIMGCMDPLNNLAATAQQPNIPGICSAMDSSTRCMDRIGILCRGDIYVQSVINGFQGVSNDVHTMCRRNRFRSGRSVRDSLTFAQDSK